MTRSIRPDAASAAGPSRVRSTATPTQGRDTKMVQPVVGPQRAVAKHRAKAFSVGLLDMVVVGGGGHVGLPLALSFAHVGLRVGILDTAEPTLQRIAGGEMPFTEAGAQPLLHEALELDRLELSSDPEILSRVDSVVVV